MWSTTTEVPDRTQSYRARALGTWCATGAPKQLSTSRTTNAHQTRHTKRTVFTLAECTVLTLLLSRPENTLSEHMYTPPTACANTPWVEPPQSHIKYTIRRHVLGLLGVVRAGKECNHVRRRAALGRLAPLHALDAEDRVSAEEELTALSSTSDLLRKLTCLQPGNTDG